VAAVAWQALDAKRRRLPHWGDEKRRRAHPTRKERATRRPVRWPTQMPLRQTRGGDRSGPDAGGCHKAQATGTGRKACRAGAPEYQPATPRGRRFRSRYGVRTHAPRVLARGNARGSRWGCHTGALKSAAGLPQRHRNKLAQ